MPKVIPSSLLALSLVLANIVMAESSAAQPTDATIANNAETADVAIAATSNPNEPADVHAQHCVACHINITDGDGSVIYTRSDRLATNETELLYWVKHFSDGLNLNLTDAELSAMRDFIKNRYYQTD